MIQHTLNVEKIKSLQKPVQFLIMSLVELIKSQRKDFESEACYNVYVDCIKQSIDEEVKELHNIEVEN